MNPQQIALVRQSFARVMPIADQAAAIFYDKLFAADPALRPLFRGDMATQRQRLMAMIASAVNLLERPTALMPVLRDLGRRHAGYGVRDAHYATVGAALLDTLATGLGPYYTAEVHEAWVALYDVVSRTMMDAATAARDERLAA